MSASKILLIILGVIVAGGCLISGCVVGGYNKAVTLDEATKNGWAQVENQLQRRYDLIPNAVAAVKGMKEHEKEVFLGVAKAREAYTQAKTVNQVTIINPIHHEAQATLNITPGQKGSNASSFPDNCLL